MYERSYGYMYEAARDLTTTEIAKRIRADVKTAVAEGLLPVRWAYSVRTDHGTAISVEVKDCADAWMPCDGRDCRDVWCKAKGLEEYAHGATEHAALTEEAQAAKMTLERIHGAYNHDGSEIQSDYFDVRYYGHVGFEDAHSAAFRAKETARLAAKKAARERGEIVGKIANYSRDRGMVVHLVMRLDDGREVVACGSRMRWGGDRAHDDAQVTCSRCARREAR